MAADYWADDTRTEYASISYSPLLCILFFLHVGCTEINTHFAKLYYHSYYIVHLYIFVVLEI